MNVKRLQDIYLVCAAQCYAGDLDPVVVKGPPRRKVYTLELDGITYIDSYGVNGDKSHGETLLAEGGNDVWVKKYFGFCKSEEALDLVKAALRANYEKCSWVAGRGPRVFEDPRWPSLRYVNNPVVGRESFERFSTDEYVFNCENGDGYPLFWHHAEGYLLTEGE